MTRQAEHREKWIDGREAGDQRRLHGTVTQYRPGRRFGFIAPATGGELVFFHQDGVRNTAVEPRVGQHATYQLRYDRKGRIKAVAVVLTEQEGN